ncbi:MAG: Crp/Fnr family transcriptional regulator [Saprospiraceae bacterium]|nr:Crp/Fnr family transcriptional regulator [Saprospiraceae bacterium]
MVDQVRTPGVATTPRRKFSRHEQVLLDYMSQIGPLSDAEIQTIFELITVKFYKKGKILLREGQVASICCFVLQGCVRQYYLIDGQEKTTHFYTEGQPVNAGSFQVDSKPSKSYLVCNEDCVLIVGDPENDFVMNRGGRVCTVSVTQVVCADGHARMRYSDLLEGFQHRRRLRFFNETSPRSAD